MIRSEIAVPVCVEEQVLAVICLNSLTARFFTEEHQRILQIIVQMIARHLAGLLQIERLTGEVQRLRSDVTYRDPKISSYRLGNIIGNSRKAQEIVDFINIVSGPLFNRIQLWHNNILQEATIGLPSVLVTGPTGAGKEFFFNNLTHNKSMSGFTDVIFCPMLVNDTARILVKMLKRELKGLYHLVGPQAMSKYQFGVEVARRFHMRESDITPKSVNFSGLIAKRSNNLWLSTRKLSTDLGEDLPNFSTGLKEFFTQYEQGYPQKIRSYQQA